MASSFASVDVVYASRLCNSATHELACLGRTRDPDHPAVWMDPLPGFCNEHFGSENFLSLVCLNKGVFGWRASRVERFYP